MSSYQNNGSPEIASPNKNSDSSMTKWNMLAVHRNGTTPSTHVTAFKQRLMSWLSTHRNEIRAFFWAMKSAQRGWPKIHMIILFHRRETAAATARVRTTLEEACEDVANVSTVATNERM